MLKHYWDHYSSCSYLVSYKAHATLFQSQSNSLTGMYRVWVYNAERERESKGVLFMGEVTHWRVSVDGSWRAQWLVFATMGIIIFTLSVIYYTYYRLLFCYFTFCATWVQSDRQGKLSHWVATGIDFITEAAGGQKCGINSSRQNFTSRKICVTLVT